MLVLNCVVQIINYIMSALPSSRLQQLMSRLYTNDDMQITPYSSYEELHRIHRHTGELSLHGRSNSQKEAFQFIVREEMWVLSRDEHTVDSIQVDWVL